MERTFILIGGAPTTGKSTVAQILATELNLPFISTDQLREIIKPYASPEKYPRLFETTNLTAEEFFIKYTPQEVANNEFKQGDEVWKAVLGTIKDRSDWVHGGIIEGVNILPHLVAQDYKNKEIVRPIFLVDPDKDRIRDVVYKRGLYGKADTYSDSLKEYEVEWVKLFTNKIINEAKKYNLPYVKINKNEGDIASIIEALGLKI